MDPIAKAAFGVARATVEVRTCYWRVRSGITFGPVAFEGTKEIRPEAVVPSGSVAKHFAIGGQGGR